MHFFPIWAMGLLYLVRVACSNSVVKDKVPNPPSNRIIGGVPALAGEFPSMTAMLYYGDLRCGGTLIGPSHVLTAANCLAILDFTSNVTLSQLKVKFNTLTLSGSQGFLERSIKNFTIHPSFTYSDYNDDIAVMVLASPITNSSLYVKLPVDPATLTTVKLPTTTTKSTTKQTQKTTAKPISTTNAPVCTCPTTPKPATSKTTLKPISTTRAAVCTCPTTKKPAALRAFATYANQLAVVTGWGSTTFGGTVSQTLMKTNVTIQDNAICFKQYPSRFKGDHQLCASAPGKDSCWGDTGGPIFVDGVQVGINSYGMGCADPNFAAVYTRISAYLDWIKMTIALNPGPASG